MMVVQSLHPPGRILWFTGLSGSGKTTLAKAIYQKLIGYQIRCEILDGDEMRRTVCQDLGFSSQDRNKNIQRIAYVAKLLSSHGIWVLVPVITPYQSQRRWVKQALTSVVEIYTQAPLSICEQRDVKGLYKKARAGEIEKFTGISDRFDIPDAPDLIVKTAEQSLSDSVDHIFGFLLKKQFLGREMKVLCQHPAKC